MSWLIEERISKYNGPNELRMRLFLATNFFNPVWKHFLLNNGKKAANRPLVNPG